MNEQSIFIAALERDPPDRPQFLDEACGDNPELRQRVERLIESHEAAVNFMDQPAGQLVQTLDQPLTERPGTIIGPYKLLQEIGHGGMGVVYMAEQTEPVERRVALKIIKPGLDTRQVIARFEAERQALAMMDHPNIAKVLDAGTTDSGRPFFVMELVKGTPITEYCDEHQLSPRERLELFVPVCQAVQHAHQKGIIHRDIKPTNVLVAEYDDRAVPKIIDFGVAKAIEHRLTEKTMFTELGQVVGTPEYMSPEQAKLNQLDIDTRSDIYSLGVLLYELLVGEIPFDRQRLRSAAFDELLRIIREEEPPRPSIRLSTSETLPSIAANRHTEPKRLSTLVRGELDWIVMKAMEKDRTRRYETANGFAADIQRYLADERVEACPPSAAYRFKKFARRNKLALATTAAVAASLIGGIVGTSWQAVRAEKERRRAVIAEGVAKERLEIVELQKEEINKERQKSIAEAERAKANYRRARSAVDEFLNKVTEDQLLSVPGLQPLRKELLGAAAKFYEEFLNEATDDPSLKLDMAVAYRKLGWLRGRLDQPRGGAYKRSLELLRSLEREGREDADVLVSSAHLYNILGQQDEAIARCQQVLRSEPEHREALRKLAVAYNDRAALSNTMTMEEQLEEFQKASDIREKLHVQDPADVKAMYQLGSAMSNTAVVLTNLGRLEEALPRHERAVEYMEKAYDDMPHQLQWGQRIALGYRHIAQILGRLQEPERALGSYQRAADVLRHLRVQNPAIPNLKMELSEAYIRLGNHQQSLHLDEDATTSFEAARVILEDLPAAAKDGRASQDLAVLCANYSRKRSTPADPVDQDSTTAVTLAAMAVSLAPDVASCWSSLGLAHYRAGDYKAAIESLQKADAIVEGGDMLHRMFLAMAYWQLGDKEKARQFYAQGSAWIAEHHEDDEGQKRFRAEAEELMGIEPSERETIIKEHTGTVTNPDD